MHLSVVGDVETGIFAVGDVTVANCGVGVVARNADSGTNDRGRPDNTMIDKWGAIFTTFQRVVFMMRYG